MAATTSRYLFGVELLFHQRHVDTGIDAETFFRPYEHVDILLQQKNITVYYPQEDRSQERAKLFKEYQEWLRRRGKEKLYELLDHDTTVLDQVRQLRSQAKSSLEAGALLITCDYLLYKFDWESSRKQDRIACTVLPNLFWQILRPFVPSSSDFDQSFAETFAIPEFRTISSYAARACSKMLYILAEYKDFPEDTAARMLSNDLLIDRLRTAKNDEEFQEYIEEAIVAENAALLEERTALAEQLERMKAEKAESERQLEQRRVEQERERAEAEQIRRKLEEAQAYAERERQSREHAERHATEAEKVAAEEKARVAQIFAAGKTALLILVMITAFELIVHKAPWDWLLKHPNSYGLQVGFDIVLALVICGFFLQKYRKWCWGAGVLTFVGVIVQILGGPKTWQP
jgi:hypothetical protein